jgi:hypothetical protein
MTEVVVVVVVVGLTRMGLGTGMHIKDTKGKNTAAIKTRMTARTRSST